jgi:glycosyltransferase involved in cell wall biosynthesis
MAGKTWVFLLPDVFGAVGGIPAFNRDLVETFQRIARERGWTLEIYALNDSENQPPDSKGYTYRSFGGNRWGFIRASLQAATRADEVFFGHVHFTPLAMAIRRPRRWLIAHGIEVWGPLNWLRRMGLLRMDRILCVSGYTRDRLIERHHVDRSRTILFPNTARFMPSDKDNPLKSREADSANVVLSVSRLWPEERYKKIDRAIEAMPAVLRSVPDAVYEIVGDGGDRPRLEHLAHDLGIEKHVRFRGALTAGQLKACYERCDVFILPSLGEGFGIVFLEAMMCGKPCIGADAGAIPEVIENGRTGLLVEPDNAEAIAVSLVRLLKDDKLRLSMGQTGRERFMSEYAFHRFQERLEKIVDQGS